MPFPLNEHAQRTIEKHFKKKIKGFSWTEECLLAAIDGAKSKDDVYWAAIGLRKVGTEKAIPILCSLLSHPMKDVKCVAILTIAHIGGGTATTILAEALLSTAYREKGYALWAIDDAADERAVPAVLAYFAKNKSKIKRGQHAAGTFVEIVTYLARCRHISPDAKQFLDEVPLFWRNICEGERTELKKRVPELAEQFEAAQRSGTDG